MAKESELMKQIWNLNYTPEPHTKVADQLAAKLQLSFRSVLRPPVVLLCVLYRHGLLSSGRSEGSEWMLASVNNLYQLTIIPRSLSSSPPEIISACNKVQMIHFALVIAKLWLEIEPLPG